MGQNLESPYLLRDKTSNARTYNGDGTSKLQKIYGGQGGGANFKVSKKLCPLSSYLFFGYKQGEIREGGRAERYKNTEYRTGGNSTERRK
jgi:hypothetical protein